MCIRQWANGALCNVACVCAVDGGVCFVVVVYGAPVFEKVCNRVDLFGSVCLKGKYLVG